MSIDGLMLERRPGEGLFAMGRARPVTSQEDLDDIAAALQGDGEAFGRLVRRYEAEIGRYMWRFTRDAAECERLTHDTFVEAYFSLPRFRGEAPLIHWLRKIATRVGYRFWKDRARERQRMEVPLEDYVERLEAKRPQAGPSEAAEALHGLLARLRPRDRLVLTLLYFEELNVREAAAMTGWTVSMVKVQAFRARKRLKVLLEQERAES